MTVAANMKFRDFNEKAGNIGASQRTLEKDLNTDIIAILNDGIKQYALKHGNNPQRIEEVVPFLKKYGLTSMPTLLAGEISYDPAIGHVMIIDSKGSKYETKITLVDGSHVRCNIVGQTKNAFTVEHEFGTMTLNKNLIADISSTRLNNLDKQILNTVQGYIDRYKTINGKYPESIAQLRTFMAGLGVERIPEPTMGNFFYQKNRGSLMIIKNNKLAAQSKVTIRRSKSAAPGAGTPQNNTAKEDVFSIDE